MNTMHFLMGSVPAGAAPNFTSCGISAPPLDMERFFKHFGPWPWLILLAGSMIGFSLWLRRRPEVPRLPFMMLAGVYASLLLLWQLSAFLGQELAAPVKLQIITGFGQDVTARALFVLLGFGLVLWFAESWRRLEVKSQVMIAVTLLLSLVFLLSKDTYWSFLVTGAALVSLLIIGVLGHYGTCKNAAPFLLLASGCYLWMQIIFMIVGFQDITRNLGTTVGAGKWAAMRVSEWSVLSHFFLHCLCSLPFVAYALVLRSRKETEDV